MDANDRLAKVIKVDFNPNATTLEQLTLVENNISQKMDELMLYIGESLDSISIVEGKDSRGVLLAYIASLKSMREVLTSGKKLIDLNQKVRKVEEEIVTGAYEVFKEQ